MEKVNNITKYNYPSIKLLKFQRKWIDNFKKKLIEKINNYKIAKDK